MRQKVLPENILKCLPKDTRKSIGQMTSAEALAKQEARNERELQKQIANYLRLKGIWFAQSRTDKRTTNGVGTPDFLFAHKLDYTNGPRAIAIEVKFDKGSLSEEQIKTIDKMTLNGWHCFTVRSLQEVMSIVRL